VQTVFMRLAASPVMLSHVARVCLLLMVCHMQSLAQQSAMAVVRLNPAAKRNTSPHADLCYVPALSAVLLRQLLACCVLYNVCMARRLLHVCWHVCAACCTVHGMAGQTLQSSSCGVLLFLGSKAAVVWCYACILAVYK
jgi:hypothetical protein